jgi:hypothetical protein
MRRRRLHATALAVALVAAFSVTGVASATPPTAVTITGTFTEATDEGTFYGATAPLCAEGTTVDLAGLAGGFQSNRLIQLLVLKEFTCADGSGTFTMLLRVHITFVPEFDNTFTWTVVGGTGNWTTLRGSGSGSAVEEFGVGGTDTYVGAVHLD